MYLYNVNDVSDGRQQQSSVGYQNNFIIFLSNDLFCTFATLLNGEKKVCLFADLFWFYVLYHLDWSNSWSIKM